MQFFYHDIWLQEIHNQNYLRKTKCTGSGQHSENRYGGKGGGQNENLVGGGQ